MYLQGDKLILYSADGATGRILWRPVSVLRVWNEQVDLICDQSGEVLPGRFPNDRVQSGYDIFLLHSSGSDESAQELAERFAGDWSTRLRNYYRRTSDKNQPTVRGILNTMAEAVKAEAVKWPG
jgi:hypothetical protein